jgi:hypothetical protein
MSSLASRVASLVLAVGTFALGSLYADSTTADEKAKPVPTVRYPFDGEAAKKFQDDLAAATAL